MKHNSFLFSLLSIVLALHSSLALAQLPPRNEIPKAPSVLFPEKPNEPELKIKVKPQPTQVDRFPSLVIKDFQFIGNTIFPTEELQRIVKPYIGKMVNNSDLQQIRDTLTNLYLDKGFVNSGAAILLRDNPKININSAVLKIHLIEGKLGEIQVVGSKRLSNYVKTRLTERGILNSNYLLEKIRLLNGDPLIKNISAKLLPTDAPNRADLEVDLIPSNPYRVEVFVNNYRNSNVGSFQRGVSATILNPLTIGDRIAFYYSNSNGSDAIQASYTAPVNTQNTAVTFQYSYGANAVIARPASILDIKGTSQSYFLGLRHPLFRRVTNDHRFEIGLGIGLEHRESQASLLGFDFPISRGASENGLTKTSVLNFTADAAYGDAVQTTSVRSDFRLGIDIDSATSPSFDRGQFFAWRGEGQWARKLPWSLLFSTRIGLQFSDRPLVASEQLTLGGIDTIPGYPQDAYLADNGTFAGIALTKAIDFGQYGRLSIGPYFNVGYGWGNGQFDEPAQLLAAPGIGLNYEFNRSLFASLNYGIPIFDLGQVRNNLQNDGLFLSISYVF
jgi:hemolysin activation/secretion protein